MFYFPALRQYCSVLMNSYWVENVRFYLLVGWIKGELL